MIKIQETPGFVEDFEKMPLSIKRKYLKQIRFMKQDFRYPSLHTKRLQGKKDVWEARIDYQYRFTFRKTETAIYLLSIGPHDAGLGKK